MLSLTPADKVKGYSPEKYKNLPDDEKEGAIRRRGDVLPVTLENVVRVLPYEGERHLDGKAVVKYVTGEEDVVEESPERVLEIANQRRRRLDHHLEQIQGALQRIR